MNLILYLDYHTLTVPVDPADQDTIQQELETTCLGCGRILKIGGFSVMWTKITAWEFVDDPKKVLPRDS